MKTPVRALLAAVLLLAVVTGGLGQTKMFLKAPTAATYLNRIILGDTTAAGARVDTHRVYVLQKGGTWLWDGSVQNASWDVHIEAADTGTGHMPEIYSMPTQGTTSVPYQLVDVAGPVYVKGVMISGYYDIDTSYVNAYGQTFILFRRGIASPDRMEFYSNVLTNSGQAYASAFGGCSVIKFVDNKMGQNCVPPAVDIGNGRILDARNVSVDSIIVQNNTLAFGFDRAIRHRNSVGRVGVYLIDHNTIYENGGRYGLFCLGAVGSKVTITNNLLVDPMAYGADTSYRRQSDFAEMGEFYPDGKVKMAWIYHSPAQSDTLPGKSSTAWSIANNYYYLTPQVTAIWDSARKMGWDPAIGMGRILTDSIAKHVDTAKAFTKLASFAFTNVPIPMWQTTLWVTKPEALGGTGGQSSGGVYIPYDRRLATYFRDTMDCTYSTSSPAYTGAWGGFPVGDLNWWPAKKAAWALTGVAENLNGALPEVYALSQNYPNPFNPTTTIAFSLPKQSQVSLKVFNILGQEVATLVNGVLNAGQHNATFNSQNLASGVYFYKIEAGSFSSTRKMMLLK